jgi:hypothetical protein
MPAIAALTINDGASTPVAHTFNPVTTDGSRAKWADRSPTIAAGFRTITHDVQEPSGARTAYKITDGFYFPVVATVNGVDTVVRFSSAQVIFNMAPDSTLQERDDALTYVLNFYGVASIRTSVENLEPVY